MTGVVRFCGDGVVDPEELCDDGNDDDTDACLSSCTLPSCGNGELDEGEECDAGADGDAACAANCQFTDNFVSVWSIDGLSTTTQFPNFLRNRRGLTLTLPLKRRDAGNRRLNYAFTVDWGDGTSSEVTSFDGLDKSHTYAEPGEYTVVISGLMEGFGLDSRSVNPHSDQLLRVPNFGNLGYVSLRNAFANYQNLTEFRGGVTTGVTDMGSMFYGVSNANPDVSHWNVSQVTNMRSMFITAILANPNVSAWDVSQVTDMSAMFQFAPNANPDVSTWDVAQVTRMSSMFRGASSANPDVSNWDVSSVTDMASIFSNATSANPAMSNWQLTNVTNLEMAFSFSNLSTENYSAFLENLASQATLATGVSMSTGPQYFGAAQAARDYLVNDLNWLIDDGGPVNCQNDFDCDGVIAADDCNDADATDVALSGL